jgi:hypothetical protein
MLETTIHNPDRFMIDLRQILAQGKKRIGLLIGAGAPVSVRVNSQGMLDSNGCALIPNIEGLTKQVLTNLDDDSKKVIDSFLPELGNVPNIETILTKIRRLSQAIGKAKVHGLDDSGYSNLADTICKNIGKIVNRSLPKEHNPYTQLASWIGGAHRDHPIEIFTPNYDLLLEEAFERLRLPYFDGFSGAHKPFFDATSISDDTLPSRWSRIWKIHGSLGWEIGPDSIIRTGSREATKLIYPDHLKYDQISRQPYSALFERLRNFLKTPDSILLCTGFSFFDAHISSVIEESLASNSHTAVMAFQFRNLDEELPAAKLALSRPNMSLYARDGAIIFGVRGTWRPGQPPTEEWNSIRSTFWKSSTEGMYGEFLLGDFATLARFFSLTQADDIAPQNRCSLEEKYSGDIADHDIADGDNA